MKRFFSTVLSIGSALLLAGGIGISVSVFHIAYAASSATVSATTKISVCGNDIKEGGEQCDRDDLGAATCTQLGYTGGTLTCGVACGFDTSQCTTAAANTAIPIFFTNVGGSYTITDPTASSTALKLIVTPHFSLLDANVYMFAFGSTTVAQTTTIPSGHTLVGDAYTVKFINASGTLMPTLNNAATLTLSYNSAALDGLDASSIAPYRHEAGETAWSKIDSFSLDTTNHTVTFTTSSFSSFALFATPPASQSVVTNTTVSNTTTSPGAITALWALPQLGAPALSVQIVSTVQYGATSTRTAQTHTQQPVPVVQPSKPSTVSKTSLQSVLATRARALETSGNAPSRLVTHTVPPVPLSTTSTATAHTVHIQLAHVVIALVLVIAVVATAGLIL